MGGVVKVLTGIGLLIGIYLFLNNWTGTVAVINGLGSQTWKGVSTLQGR